MLSAGKYERYYKKARIAQAMLREEIAKAFGRYDILLASVCPAGADSQNLDTYTVPANLAGLPAIAVGSTQLIGKRFDDAALLGFAGMLPVPTAAEAAGSDGGAVK
jgi:Asp-tRNA(Asn)/Glu-tRNA(Gln) amidotransferase A subunit family amidase